MIDFSTISPHEEEPDPGSSYKIGDPLPEALASYDVTIKSLGLDVTIDEGILVRGDRDKDLADEFWYNHLNGNGVLDLLVQLHAVYFPLCEYRDTIKAAFLREEAFSKNKYKNGSTRKVSEEMYGILMQVNRSANTPYWELKEALADLNRQVERVQRTLDLMNKVYEVARTRNANSRAMQ